MYVGDQDVAHDLKSELEQDRPGAGSVPKLGRFNYSASRRKYLFTAERYPGGRPEVHELGAKQIPDLPAFPFIPEYEQSLLLWVISRSANYIDRLHRMRPVYLNKRTRAGPAGWGLPGTGHLSISKLTPA